MELLEPCYWFLVILAVLVLTHITVSPFVAFFVIKIASSLKSGLTMLITILLGLKLGATGFIGAKRPLLLVTI